MATGSVDTWGEIRRLRIEFAVDWRSGVGPEVRGKAIDLLLLVANRRQVVDQLDGPGVGTLDLYTIV